MKNKVFIFIFLCFSALANAQVHEIGVSVGGTNFIGDIGSTTYIYPNQIGGALFYKYNYNPRLALRGTLSYLPIEGNDFDSNDTFRQDRGLSFSNTINEIAAGIEFNFYEYNILDDSKKWTPYLLLEFAAFTYNYDTGSNSESSNSMAIPFGIGYKSRLSGQMAFSFETLEKEAREEVLKSMNELYMRIEELEHEDWFSTFLNSVVGAFDPHTTYMAPSIKERFDQDMSGKLEGIGARLQKKGIFTHVVELVSGGPAWKQGDLEPGDIILKVAQGDGEPLDIVGMRLDDAITFIKGKKGTEVRLTVKKKIDGSTQIITINSFGVDISGYYQSFEEYYGAFNGRYRIGFNITNIGPKVNYTTDPDNESFIPTNLKLGGGFEFILDDYNSVNTTLEFTKLLVPTPPVRDEDGEIVEGEDDNVGFISGIFQSFGDAPGGFSEEISEF
ncbi:DUF6089 family protein, partial [Polaribacter sp.]|nr:DUF6089 family protein [Polaribacter sp.]